MPPRQKTETIKPEETVNAVKAVTPDPYDIHEGSFVHVVTAGGAKYSSAEVLRISSRGLSIRTHPLGPTKSEVTIVPWTSIDGVGIVGAR